MSILIEVILMIFTLGSFTAVPLMRARFGAFAAGILLILVLIGSASFWTDRLDYLKPINAFSRPSKLLQDVLAWMTQATQAPVYDAHRVITTPISPKYERRGSFPQQDAFVQIQTVTDFFHALGRSDGFTASSLLLPQNRGSGELADREFDKFSQMLKQPLNLEYVIALQENLVKAKYNYTRQDGLTCNGIAYVSLSKKDDIWLISDINGTRC